MSNGSAAHTDDEQHVLGASGRRHWLVARHRVDLRGTGHRRWRCRLHARPLPRDAADHPSLFRLVDPVLRVAVGVPRVERPADAAGGGVAEFAAARDVHRLVHVVLQVVAAEGGVLADGGTGAPGGGGFAGGGPGGVAEEQGQQRDPHGAARRQQAAGPDARPSVVGLDGRFFAFKTRRLFHFL